MSKVMLVGDGAVGSAFANDLLQHVSLDELIIVDRKTQKAAGDAMDLEDLAMFDGTTVVRAGKYEDAADTDVVVITAGIPRKPGESRLDLVNKNVGILKTIIDPIVNSGFKGIFVVASNPVDILTTLTQRISGFPKNRVIGTGTSLDTARLRVALAKRCHVPVREISVDVLGEHGDTSFANFDEATIAGKPLKEFADVSDEELEEMQSGGKKKGGAIIRSKGATYYGVARCLSLICEAIIFNRSIVLPLSAPLNGQYGINDLYLGTPASVNRTGIRYVIETPLSKREVAAMQYSAAKMKEVLDGVEL